MATAKKATTTKKAPEKKGAGGRRLRAGRPADEDPKVQVSGRVHSWASDWITAEVDEGRARSIAGLVGELIEEALAARGVKEPTKV